MDVKALLAKCISLLFREGQSGENDLSKQLVLDVITTLKINSNDISGTDSTVNELKNVVLNMVSKEHPTPYNDLIQHIRIACSSDVVLFESIQDNISFQLDEDELKRTILSYRFELNKYLKEKKATMLLDKMTFDLKFNRDKIGDLNQYMSSNLNGIIDLVNYSGEEIPGIICEVDLSDIDAVAEQFELIRKENDGSRTIKMPWQAMNRMTRGGLRLGQLTTVGGLAHNNKTGVSLSMFISGCIFNNPKNLQTDQKKKPLMLLISFEDDMLIVLFNLYILLKENLENVKITDEDKQRLSSREAAEYVYKKLSDTGYDIRIIRADSSTWSYAEIQSCILQFESQGYEIHLTLIDYLNLANKNGLSHSRADADIQELFRRTKNFFAAKNIALLTPVQLSPDAMELKRQGNKMLAMQISDGSYYEGCRGLSREPELELFVDIVKDNGRKYQTFARGKHRGQNDTPEEHKFFILEFQKIGGLRWDVNGTDTSLSKFGSVRNAEGEEEGAFWDIGN
nr:MAG TPA: DNA polymerase B Like Replicative Helicase [Caudoviricetes sp.]DAS30674.1 MAG TPA: DNA polymerase B Like Replicative Helicase [Caudoviricetes sp.]